VPLCTNIKHSELKQTQEALYLLNAFTLFADLCHNLPYSDVSPYPVTTDLPPLQSLLSLCRSNMAPGSKLPTPMGKFAASCTNTSQFLSSRQTKTDGTLPVPGDSGEGKKKLKVPSLQNHITQENLTTAFGNSKCKQNTRTAETIKQISTLLVLNVSLEFIHRVKNANNESPGCLYHKIIVFILKD
jgi:hypothetical protein